MIGSATQAATTQTNASTAPGLPSPVGRGRAGRSALEMFAIASRLSATLDFEQVLVHVRRVLQRDFERHRFWLVVDAIGLVISGALAVIPGPNLLAYFFLFRVGGHWLSMRGATQGRRRVVWTGRPCEALVRLRAALQGDGPDRHQRIQGIASELHLRSLAPFVERVARVKR